MDNIDVQQETKVPLIGVAIAAFNRKSTTISCLETLFSQKGNGKDFHLAVTLLDDKSTDGTADAVRTYFPQVDVVNGNGSLYWGGGMNMAMSRAVKNRPDFVLLLNDDVKLYGDTISVALLAFEKLKEQRVTDLIVLVGSVVEPGTQTISYSGYKRTSHIAPNRLERILASQDVPQRCDTMNGNFVLVPRTVYDLLGVIDKTFIHQLGDIDYGYRLNAIGGEVWISPNIVGECAKNTRKLPFQKEGLSLYEKWQHLNSPLGMPVYSWATFMWRHGGFLG